eukprot:3414294-Amphidinium_carterae.1
MDQPATERTQRWAWTAGNNRKRTRRTCKIARPIPYCLKGLLGLLPALANSRTTTPGWTGA